MGNVFQNIVINIVFISFTLTYYPLYDKKYERFEKRRTKINARLPDCLKNEIQLGDWIEIKECRPLSKIIHFIATKKIRSKTENVNMEETKK